MRSSCTVALHLVLALCDCSFIFVFNNYNNMLLHTNVGAIAGPCLWMLCTQWLAGQREGRNIASTGTTQRYPLPVPNHCILACIYIIGSNNQPWLIHGRMIVPHMQSMCWWLSHLANTCSWGMIGAWYFNDAPSISILMQSAEEYRNRDGDWAPSHHFWPWMNPIHFHSFQSIATIIKISGFVPSLLRG